MLIYARIFLTILFSAALISACSNASQRKIDNGTNHYRETGKASYYADKYQFRPTASGELFNQLAKTAAHKHLPFGTIVRVKNMNNGKSVLVKINDRGPYVKGRIIDLSKSAFGTIANTREGVITVEITALE